MAAPAHEALIDLELTLSKSLARAWRKKWVPLEKRIKRATKASDFDRAHEIADKIDFGPIARKHLKLARTVGNAALLLGGSRITGGVKSDLSDGQRQEILNHLLTQFEVTLSKNATEQARTKAHDAIEKLQRGELEDVKTIIKQAKPAIKPFTFGAPVIANIGAVGTYGDEFASLVSNIHTSRLNSFGFLSTAMEQQITHYQVNEVMDNRTCPVCREMDARVFTVSQGVQHAMNIMQNDDPDSVRMIAPWPNQSNKEATKATVASIGGKTSGELAQSGLSLPPYHPSCRGFITTTTERAAARGITHRAGGLAEGIIKRAKTVEKKVTRALKAAAGKDAKMIGLDFRIKGKGSLARKIRDNALLDGHPLTTAADDIGDALRYTMEISEANYNAKVKSTLAALKKKGYVVEDYRNFWGTPGKKVPIYQGINTNIRAPGGQVFELQFHTPASFNTKEFLNHKMYEAWRKVGITEARKTRLAELMRQNQMLVEKPAGAYTVQWQGALRSYKAPVRTLGQKVWDISQVTTRNTRGQLVAIGDMENMAKLIRDAAQIRIAKPQGSINFGGKPMAAAVKTLEPIELYSLRAYSRLDFRPLNRALWAGGVPFDEAAASYETIINGALDKLPKFKGTTYRGHSFKGGAAGLEAGLERYKVGNVINELGFGSTSTKVDTIVDFGVAGGAEAPQGVTFIYEAMGKSGVNISAFAQVVEEAEVLFKSGTWFEVLEVDMSGSILGYENQVIVRLREYIAGATGG
jgi:hypothetical protein